MRTGQSIIYMLHVIFPNMQLTIRGQLILVDTYQWIMKYTMYKNWSTNVSYSLICSIVVAM